MHIEGPWLSTTRTKTKQKKITKAQQEEIERGWRERNSRLKELGLAKETIEQYTEWLYGKGKKTKSSSLALNSACAKTSQKTSTTAVPAQPASQHIQENPARPWITGPVSTKPSPIYTGTKVKGIGSMHKSNAVPVFSDEEAIDISRMRR